MQMSVPPGNYFAYEMISSAALMVFSLITINDFSPYSRQMIWKDWSRDSNLYIYIFFFSELTIRTVCAFIIICTSLVIKIHRDFFNSQVLKETKK